jgi:NitT/TauT family transport system substrate-binding protein
MKPTGLRFLSLLVGLGVSLTPARTRADELKVATSIYPGWMDNWLMEMALEKGQPSFLAQRTAASKSRVEIVKFKEYIPSVEALVAGKVDACTMTLQEALAFPEDSGIEVAMLLVHDYSNGNDGVTIPRKWKLDEMKGKPIVAEEFSVSQYLIHRWLQIAGKPRDYLNFKNTSGDDVSKVFLAVVGTPQEVAGATWNPHVFRILQSGKATLVFSSKDIPGEIVDCLVIRKDRMAGREKAIQAYIAAHYDVMTYFTDLKTRYRAIKAMTIAAGFNGDDASLYSQMLAGTRFYTTREETAAFMGSAELKETQAKARTFLQEFGAFKSAASKKLEIDFDTTFLQ